MTGVYDIVALRYATLPSRKSELYLRWEVYDEPDVDLALDYFFYLLRDGERTILVDTGFSLASGTRRGRTCVCPPVQALERLGVAPSDVSHVIVSHFHYDHVGNLDAYPCAEILVPEREVAFWTSPVARRAQFWAHVEAEDIAWIEAADRKGRLTRYNGHSELLPGITAITVGGHAPGQQVFVVTTAGRPVLLASDAVHFYEELELRRPFGVVVDLVEMYEAYDVVQDLERSLGAVLVAGHDPEVTARFPAVDATGVARQIS